MATGFWMTFLFGAVVGAPLGYLFRAATRKVTRR